MNCLRKPIIAAEPFPPWVGEDGLQDIDLVIFDCDGVLVDSEVLAVRVTAAQLEEIGVSMSFEETLEVFMSLGPDAARRQIEIESGITLPADFRETTGGRMKEAFPRELRPIAGIENILVQLTTPYCVASNSSHARLRETFEIIGFTPFFEGRVFSAEDVARRKPAPDLFLHAASRMGDVDPARCLVIEDSTTGVAAARAAGMRVIGFCGGGHIRDGHDRRLLELGAEWVARDCEALSQTLRLGGDSCPDALAEPSSTV